MARELRVFLVLDHEEGLDWAPSLERAQALERVLRRARAEPAYGEFAQAWQDVPAAAEGQGEGGSRQWSPAAEEPS